MAQFNGMVVTNKGRELLARALASKGKFIITAAALGDGAYSGNLRECEELVNKKLDLILLGVYSEKGSTKITVGITNKNVSESFRTNEIGVYAKLEGDAESVLYAYDVAVEADTMPNNSLGTTLELVYDIYFDVSSEVEVTLEITDSIAFLTQDIAKREFLKTYIVSGGDLKGKIQLEADKQYLADDGKWYQNIGGDRVWEKSGVPDELLIEISWKTLMDEIAKKENKILVKNTAFNKNFGTAENEVLEGIQLARTLGLEYGGDLNNSNTKTINTIYYDTQNKSFFKCFQENTLNYADSNYYEGISNNDLLLKLQNLTKITNVFLIEINPDTPAGTRYMLPFNANSYKKISVIAYEIYHGVTTSVNMEYQSHWNLSGIRAFRYHLLDKYSLFLEISQNNEILIKENSVSLDRKQYIYRLEFWGELPKN